MRTIALVFDGLDFGGIERVGIDYSNILIDLGYKVDVYNLMPNKNGMITEFSKECRIINHNFGIFLAPETYSYGVKKWWWGRFAYPVMHTFFTFVTIVYKIFTKHYKSNYDIAVAFSGHMNDLTFIDKKFINSKKKICWLHGALYGYMLSSPGYFILYQRIKNLVVLVEDAQEHVFQYNSFLNLNIKKLYNPSYVQFREVEEDKVRDLKGLYGDFILMVARFAYPHKDHYTVVDMLYQLNAEYKLNKNLVFLGEGPDFEDVKNYTFEKGLEKNVFFLGNVRDVQNYYKAAYILVHSSVSGEGLPTVIIEALGLGLPVVSTDSKVGPREILRNDEYGLLCDIKNPYEMAKKVSSLYIDSTLYSEYSRKGLERFNSFSPKIIKTQLVDVLNNLW